MRCIMLAKVTLVSIQLLVIGSSGLLCQASQLSDREQLQARLQTIKLAKPNATADLSLLINETLAINNKTVGAQNVDKQAFKDDWTFEMVEYDLIEFLQDLSARYKQSNESQSVFEPTAVAASGDDDQLYAKRIQQQASPEDKPSTKMPINADTSAHRIHPTAIPVLSTSLASGEPELAESSWQYGIFDRFTRPRSTTTTQRPTTEDPQYSPEAGAKLDVRNFNADECGLRTYEDVPYFSPEGDIVHTTLDEQISPLLKREKLPSFDLARKKVQLESVGTLLNDRADQDGNATKSKKKEFELDDIFANFKEQNLDSLVPPESPASQSGDIANNLPVTDLVSRRNWMQQKIGNTLQMLGFNLSQAVSDASNVPATNLRENLMKKSSKVGKSVVVDRDDQPANSLDQKLVARQDELKLEARVIGGSDARLGDSPWSVSLQALVSRPGNAGVEYRHYCGGTIISEHYVLTAAHCLDFMVGRESRLFVVVGDINWRMSTASLYGRRFGVEKLMIHSGYKSTAFGHDIGLIKTKESMRPLKVNGKYIINSVCLPNKGVEASGEAELVGWGLFSNRNEMADQLQIADVPVLPRPLCVDLYRRRTGLIQWLIGIELITDKQVCAGTFGRGICQGDSGSALVMNEKISRQGRSQELQAKIMRDRGTRQTRATHIGIVAFGGIRRCSYQSLPGVYMQTSKYLDWILPRIQN